MAEIAGPRAGASGMGGPGPARLDSPPPLPPEATRRPTPRQLAGEQETIGAESSNPQIMALQAMQGIESAVQQLAAAIPGMAPQLMGLVMSLREAVPQQLAQSANTPGVMPPGGAGMPPSVGPPQQMPQGMPQGAPQGMGM